MFHRVIDIYLKKLSSNPLLINAGSGFLIASIGDIVCQRLESSNALTSNIDVSRVIKMGSIRAFIIVPFIQRWYPLLIYFAPGKQFTQVIKRVAIDQAIGSPIVVGLVFSVNGVFNQKNISELGYQISTQGFHAWLKGLQYWPFIHLITFSSIPLKHQPLFSHIASLYWNYLLSYYSHQ